MKGNKTGVDADDDLLLDLEYTCAVCEHTRPPETHMQTEDGARAYARTHTRTHAHTNTRARTHQRTVTVRPESRESEHPNS